MNRSAFVTTAALLAAAVVSGSSQTALSQENIQVEYGKTSKFTNVLATLRQRKALEILQAFLSPLKFPLKVTIAECGGYYAPYKSEESLVTLCYEYVDLIESVMPGESSLPEPEDHKGVFRNVGQIGPALITREMATVGPFVAYALHETAVAVFDKLEAPVWGRLHDAADYLSAYMMFQFGTDVARKSIYGTAYFLNQWDAATRDANFRDPNYLGDIRSTVRQRYYNLVCIAVGRDPVGFSTFIAVGRKPEPTDLPIERFGHCRGSVERTSYSSDYEKVKNAFMTTIMPKLDEPKLKKVQGTKWIPD
jgi:Putative metallopeptidase